MSNGIKAIAVGLAFLALLSLITVGLAYEQVPEGHQGVEKNWDAVTGTILDPGANWIIPVMQSVQHVEVRPRTYTMSQTQGEGDKAESDAITVKTVNGSSVKVDVTIRYRIDAERADQFVVDWNDEGQMEQRLIRPTIRSDLRDTASDLETSEIYTQQGREALQTTARESLREEFEGEPIVLEEVQIRNIDLPNSIDKRLDEKEEAKQQVQIERERVKQEEQRAQQRIAEAQGNAKAQVIEAEGDAEAIRIQGEALEDNEIVLEQRYIEALREGETIYVPSEGLTLTRETGNDSGNNTDD